jgi:hypothetical protein
MPPKLPAQGSLLDEPGLDARENGLDE